METDSSPSQGSPLIRARLGFQLSRGVLTPVMVLEPAFVQCFFFFFWLVFNSSRR